MEWRERWEENETLYNQSAFPYGAERETIEEK